jgi:hypothetical protein
MLGLNISAGMRTAVSIYILIPLLLVPMLLLGGAMIKFDDLHKSISRKVYVPVIGDVMVTRWAYEALMVEEFRNNRFEKPFYENDSKISRTDWQRSFLIGELKLALEKCRAAGKNPEFEVSTRNNFRKLNHHIKELSAETGLVPGSWFTHLNYYDFNDEINDLTKSFLDSLMIRVREMNRTFILVKDSISKNYIARLGESGFQKLREENYNENLADIVLNTMSTSRIYDSGKKFIQKADPVYTRPGSKYGRAHFYAPFKQVGNVRINTLWFNILAIWIMTLFLFITLYFNALKRFIAFLESMNVPIWRKFGRELLKV